MTSTMSRNILKEAVFGIQPSRVNNFFNISILDKECRPELKIAS
jgi:hypothetical protein